ncbi:phage virion morphogenesis protein [Halomonas daqingensis]|uniref:phage virion morphogenesis protein n=1 Tax=Billgrantia desiderata TaxID=52021 RepID=UPI001F36AFEE|nr:phage virion morphogenesis protein [Halomonas desiderata]MCE8027534.1 phage virion morphogenesis protein [Halomonas desiderata]
MAGVTLDYRIDNDQVMRALEELNARGRDAQPAFAAIGEDLDRSHRGRFDKQVSPAGNPWAALSEEYRRRKPQRQDEILVLNGYLRDTLRYDAGPDFLQFGTDRVYGATHHFGDDERGIPERPWLGLSPDDEAAAERTLLDFLNDALVN